MFGRKPKDEKKEAAKQPATAPALYPELGRNDPCHCGSGKKYKKCCMSKDEAAERQVLEKNWEKAAAAAAAAAKEQPESEAKAKESSNTTAKPTGPQKSTKQQHPTFVPNQVAMPRKSGGG
jgi:hypothetical protein